jgi:hypothetical protein
MRRHLWQDRYSQNNPPFWPCPACDRETMQPILKSLVVRQPAGAILMGVKPTEGAHRFSQFFQCAIRECGDILVVVGHADLDPNPDSTSDHDKFIYTLFPFGIHRAPPVIEVPLETPDSVREELLISFKLYWADLGSCANRLRISVERALDELGIPTPGTLNQRIDAFKDVDADHAETFHALREVGNVGSHLGNVTRETLLDAFEIYEDALRNLFGGHKLRIESLKQSIRAAKGK